VDDSTKIPEKIYESLQRLTGLHRQLMETVRMERVALVAADIPRIEEATVAKQAIIEAIRAAESDRLKCTIELAVALHKQVRDLTLPNIIIIVQGYDQKLSERLQTAFNALTLLIKRISEQNTENQTLVENSLMHIQNMKNNVLRETVPKSTGYTSKGQKSNGRNGARLIEKDA
jgi:hypothetical protein